MISWLQSLDSLHVTRVHSKVAKGSPLFHPTNTNSIGHLSDACTWTELNHVVCVIAKSSVRPSGLIRFLYENLQISVRLYCTLLKTRRSGTLRSGNHHWHFSTTARACRSGYKCNVCRHIVQWIRWPLLSIADFTGTQSCGQWTSENRTIGTRTAIPFLRPAQKHSAHRTVCLVGSQWTQIWTSLFYFSYSWQLFNPR